jgi:hypothetical protein
MAPDFSPREISVFWTLTVCFWTLCGIAFLLSRAWKDFTAKRVLLRANFRVDQCRDCNDPEPSRLAEGPDGGSPPSTGKFKVKRAGSGE